MIKFNHKGKNFSERMGLSEKRWGEVTQLVKKAMMETSCTPDAIEYCTKHGVKGETEIAVASYVIGAIQMKNQETQDLAKFALLATLLK